ncbi:MAG: GDSL-type esterase/lipase family protein [Bryobacteraceae bacterium]|nr:GDSL-type esterase/lipase family protein [Bryobacteraceae bacterium]
MTIASFVMLLALMDYMPVLKDYKVMDWRSVPNLFHFTDRRNVMTPELEPETAVGAGLRAGPETRGARVHPVLDPGKSLDGFFRALHRAEGKRDGTQVRVMHYGDSPTTADMITSDARDLLQKHFGDAGHGFCLVAKPWAWYQHSGLDIEGDGWTIDPANMGGVRDGLFGLGGVSFRGWSGAFSRIRMKKGKHSRVEIAYLKQPGGGVFQVEAAGKVLGVVNTAAKAEASGFASFPIPVAADSINVRNTNGQVRIFGVVFESDASGVIYNSLGVNGAYVSVLARFISEAHWREQLQHYAPDLVIINYGTNESTQADFVDRVSEKELREVIRRVRSAVPQAAILIMSPMDRGHRTGSGGIDTVPTIPRLVAIQERVALDTGCAFFNTFAAMGGAGTMARWYEAEPRLVGADFIHPMPAGARIVGGLLYRALFDGYNKYKLRLLDNRKLASVKDGVSAAPPARL